MGFLVIVAIFMASAIVFFFLLFTGKIPFSATLVIMSVGLLFLLCLSAVANIKLTVILVATCIALGLFLNYTASGLTSLLWWLNKDTTPAEKEKRKTCPACGAENMLGRLFCVKCGEQMIFPTNVKNLKISEKIATDGKIAEKPLENNKNTLNNNHKTIKFSGQ